MATKKYLDNDGLLYFWQKIKNKFVQDNSYVHTDNNFTTALKNKLDALDENGEENIIETVKVNNTALTPDANKAVNITVPTTAADVNALPSSTLYGATLTLGMDSSTYTITATLKDQNGNTLGTAQSIDLPLESVVVSGAYDAQTKKVVLTLEDGSTIEFSVADLVSGLQTEITSTNKLSADLVADGTTNKVVTATEKATWNGKQNALTQGTNITISGNTISATDTTYSDFTGTTGSSAGTSGLVPAPATTDAGSYLKADGTWSDPTFTLPIASASDLGGVKIGTGLTIVASTGVLSLTDTMTAITNAEIDTIVAS